MNISPTSPFAVDASQSPATTGNTPSQAAPASTDALTSENTFLKLLVAQIKNQDPTSPTDPTQFVAQLTQYSELEQLIQINGNVKALDGNASSSANPIPAAPSGSASGIFQP